MGSDRSEVLRASRQKLSLKIEIVDFFGFPNLEKNLSDLAKVQRLLESGRCFNTRIPGNFKGDPVKFLVSF